MYIDCDGNIGSRFYLWVDDQPWTFQIENRQVINWWFDGDDRMYPAPDYEDKVVKAVKGWVNSDDSDVYFCGK